LKSDAFVRTVRQTNAYEHRQTGDPSSLENRFLKKGKNMKLNFLRYFFT